MNQSNMNSINFLKTNATLFIAMLHFFLSAGIGRVGGWAIFVDFFFVVSGLLLAFSCESKKLSTISYIKERYKKIWPHFIFGFVVYFGMLFVQTYPEWHILGGYLAHSFLEVFLLQVFGVNEFAANHGAVWYLSVLMVCSSILYPVLRSRIKKVFIRYIAPLCAILILFINQILYGTEIVEWNSCYGFIGNPSFYRGLYGMSAGIWIYYFSKEKKDTIEVTGSVYNGVLQLTEITLLLFIIIGSVFRINTLLLVLAIWVMVFLSWNLRHISILSNSIYDRLSVYLLPVYINHALFVDSRIILKLSQPLWIQTGIYLIVVFVYSAISYKVVNAVVRKAGKRPQSIF